MLAPGQIVTRYYEELWNLWHFELIPELIAPDITFRGSLGIDVSGRDGFRGYMETVRTAFPDFHNTIEEMIVEGDRVAARLSYRGTHLGPLLGVQPTKRPIAYSGVAIFHLREQQIVSGWVLGDAVSLWHQIGIVPPIETR